jgi:hypothetical protein
MRRINLFDVAVAGFVIVLIPIAYGTWLLFRAPHPLITSVTRVEITREERRIGGPNLVAKLKVRGSGLRPMLRATIDGVPAIGLVFETPNSADLLLGAIPAGSHDLILYDGVQEVARAPGTVSIDPPVARSATLRVRLDSPTDVTRLVRVGDRDWTPSANGAVVTGVDKELLTVRVGAVPLDAGWQYYGEDLKPGVAFTLTTRDYVVKGTVLSVSMDGRP